MPETTKTTDSTYTSKPTKGTTYDTKPPSDPTCKPTPPVTYDGKPADPTYKPTPPATYDGKPSDPTYKPTPPTTYDGKPSDAYKPTPPTTYDGKPSDTYKPTPPTTYDGKPSDTYKPTPPGNTYGSPPTYNPPPIVRKECTCGTAIPEDCTCNHSINIKGRIREHIKNCSYEFVLPCNHIAVMYGVRTAVYEQIVNISIRRKSERKPYKEWSFEGKKDAMLLNLEGSPEAYNLNVLPEDVDRSIVITFQSYDNSEYHSSDMRYKEIVISSDTSSQCSYFYTFFVEAGDDCDYHDTDFCVSVLPCRK